MIRATAYFSTGTCSGEPKHRANIIWKCNTKTCTATCNPGTTINASLATDEHAKCDDGEWIPTVPELELTCVNANESDSNSSAQWSDTSKAAVIILPVVGLVLILLIALIIWQKFKQKKQMGSAISKSAREDREIRRDQIEEVSGHVIRGKFLLYFLLPHTSIFKIIRNLES